MNKPKILLVDDEEAIRLSGKYALDVWFDVTTVETTAKALELLKKGKFDLILLDIMIKEEGPESGIAALKIINEEYPSTPVIMMTGTVTWMQKWDQLKQLGAKAYLGKPFDRDDAKNLIEKHLLGGAQ